MQGMRDLIRSSLARSLRTLTEEDRLAAALPLVCGTTLASHCEVASLDANRTLHLRIDGGEWIGPLLGMRDILQYDLQRVAGVALHGLHFVQANPSPARSSRSAASPPPEPVAESRPETPGASKRNPRRRPA